MEWVKLPVNIIDEDLSDRDLANMVKAICITGRLESLPNTKQLSRYMSRNTAESILKHNSNTLQTQLKHTTKYQINKEKNKIKVAQWREKKQDVTSCVTSNVTAMNRIEEKRREENIKSKPKRNVTTFQKPQLQQVADYMNEYSIEKSIEIDLINEPDNFFDYYSANGWKVGKNAMKDWKATCRNWLRNTKNFNKSNKNSNSAGDTLEEMMEFANSIDLGDGK